MARNTRQSTNKFHSACTVISIRHLVFQGGPRTQAATHFNFFPNKLIPTWVHGGKDSFHADSFLPKRNEMNSNSRRETTSGNQSLLVMSM